MRLGELVGAVITTAVLTWQFMRVKHLYNRRVIAEEYGKRLIEEQDRWLKLLEQHRSVSRVGEVVSIDHLVDEHVLIVKAEAFPEDWTGKRVVIYPSGTSYIFREAKSIAPDISE